MLNIDFSPESVAVLGRAQTLADFCQLMTGSLQAHGGKQLEELVFCLEFFMVNYLQGTPTGLSRNAEGRVADLENEALALAEDALELLRMQNAEGAAQKLQACVARLEQLEAQNERLALLLVDRETSGVTGESLN